MKFIVELPFRIVSHGDDNTGLPFTERTVLIEVDADTPGDVEGVISRALQELVIQWDDTSWNDE